MLRPVTDRSQADVDVRDVRPDELEAWYESASSAFFMWPWDAPASAAFRLSTTGFDRMIAAFEGETIVGTYRSFPTELTLPGGTAVPVGGVTGVTVRPTHRRRGILTKLVARDIRTSLEREEAAEVLVAAEYGIYGRFGFGHAVDEGRYELRARHLRLSGAATGRVEIVGAATARELVAEIYERHRLAQHGELKRESWRFDFELGITEFPPRPRWKGQIAVHRDAAGTPDAYVRYRGEEHWDAGIPDNTLVVDELVGASPEGELELWRYLSSIDLVEQIAAHGRRVAEPLRWTAVDARAVRLTGVFDMLWLRPLDLARLLAARSYLCEGRVVLEVVDELPEGSLGPCAGRWELEASPDGASVVRSTASPDLTVHVSALAAACLGGARLADAVRRTGVDEHRKGALERLDLLLRTLAPPWCSTYF